MREEKKYLKSEQSPNTEFLFALNAVLAACGNAGISPKEIDGFASFCNDPNDPFKLAATPVYKELPFSNIGWGGGSGGGDSAAIAKAFAAIYGVSCFGLGIIWSIWSRTQKQFSFG